MKRLITLLLVVSFLPGFSQSADHLVTKASLALTQGDYSSAFKDASSAVDQIHMLKKDRDKCKAYYIRSKAAMELVRSGSTEATYKDLITACDHILKIESMDCKSEQSKAAVIKPELHGFYQRLGLGFLNQAYQNNLTPADRKTLYQAAVDVLTADTKLQPNEYMTYDLMAQAKLGLQDSVAAYDDFCKTVELHKSNLPANPDQLIAYAYYRKALLERYKMNDLDKALNSIIAGEEALDKEYERHQALAANYDANGMARIKQQYKDAKADLNAFRLDIYLNSPDKYDEALADFEKAIKNNPKDYTIHVAYASLLEQSDKAKAEEIYKKAIAINDNKSIAHFNLAALYMNKANALAKKANSLDDYGEAEKYYAEMKTHMEKAYPHLKKCIELDPCDRTTIQTLLQATMNLEMMDEYKKYKQMKADCGF